MKVLLYSHSFYPSIGGIETVSLTLAEGFCQCNINIKVITKTTASKSHAFPFEIVINPSVKRQINLLKWADVVLFNGASLALQPWVILLRKPFIWIHAGYQVSCIDGLGWVNGKKAPLHPLKSITFHSKLIDWRYGVKEGAKLLIRRIVAKYFVTKNVAITRWMSQVQPLPRQVHIYNPFPLNKYLNNKHTEPEFDFLYLGRIVSEKGVATLLKAFASIFFKNSRPLSLLIIGDGNWRHKMEALARQLCVSHAVTFVGSKTGNELVDWVSKGRIAVVPSEWYEAMGGVALELLAAGKNIIVSEYGGLKECVGGAGLTFPNGNDKVLADCMIQLLNDEVLRKEQLDRGREQMKLFEPSIFISKYIDLLHKVVR